MNGFSEGAGQAHGQVASMAKTINAILVGIAIEEGSIESIDEPAATWLPAWRGDARRKITLRHLLQMHSGLQPRRRIHGPFLRCLLPRARHRPSLRRRQHPGRRGARNTVRLQQCEFPGSRFHPGGGHRPALCRVPVREALEADRRLRRPRSGSTVRAVTVRTFGYLFATPEDWARVGLLLLHNGRQDSRQIIPRSYFELMLTPSTDRAPLRLGDLAGPQRLPARARRRELPCRRRLLPRRPRQAAGVCSPGAESGRHPCGRGRPRLGRGRTARTPSSGACCRRDSSSAIKSVSSPARPRTECRSLHPHHTPGISRYRTRSAYSL